MSTHFCHAELVSASLLPQITTNFLIYNLVTLSLSKGTQTSSKNLSTHRTHHQYPVFARHEATFSTTRKHQNKPHHANVKVHKNSFHIILNRDGLASFLTKTGFFILYSYCLTNLNCFPPSLI